MSGAKHPACAYPFGIASPLPAWLESGTSRMPPTSGRNDSSDGFDPRLLIDTAKEQASGCSGTLRCWRMGKPCVCRLCRETEPGPARIRLAVPEQHRPPPREIRHGDHRHPDRKSHRRHRTRRQDLGVSKQWRAKARPTPPSPPAPPRSAARRRRRNPPS